MSHFLLYLVVSIVVGGPIIWFNRRGGFGARGVYERAREELKQNGRASIRAPLWLRIIGVGPLELDVNGFTYSFYRSKHAYTWTDVTKPFVLEPVGRTNYQVKFYVRVKNRNKGRLRIFKNTRSEFIDVKQRLNFSYCMGWDKLLAILNQCWNEAFMASKKLEF